MNNAQIFAKFSEGINWNAFLYVFYKILYTALSFLLLHALSTKDFSAWANINGIIFLILLWIDCGFRKSVPRYCPQVAKDKKLHRHFVKAIILFQATLLIITVPAFFFLIKQLSSLLGLELQVHFFYLGGIVFITEGLISIMRLIYHAHFWNKQFNLLHSVIALLEMIANILLIINMQSSSQLLDGIFIIKIIRGIIIVTASTIMLRLLYKGMNYSEEKINNPYQLRVDFIKHSAIMWASNSLKSITERNFLIPLFTYALGQTTANIFKVASDGALLFNRTVLKTIGTTDTTLLAHIETLPGNKHLLPLAFKKLTTKVASLCLPLLGILMVFFLYSTFVHDIYVFQVFFIVTFSYLLEALFSPYERVLEVKRRYLILLIAYLPYVFMLCIAYYYQLMTSLGLIGSIIIIQSVRLVSSIFILITARQQYALRFPVRNISIIILITTIICLLLYSLLTYLGLAQLQAVNKTVRMFYNG